MNKFIKSTLAVTTVAVVGICSYSAYGSYGGNPTEDDLLVENVEALAQSQGGDYGPTDDRVALCHILSTGRCGTEYEQYTVKWEIKGGKKSASIYMAPSGKYCVVGGSTEFVFPSGSYEMTTLGKQVTVYASYAVCCASFNTCDRCLQKVPFVESDGTVTWITDCYRNLDKPGDALD